jgi:pimeloyl-ACP methyl ester carboxylesterase
MTASPIVVLVHGAWHGGWCWAPLQTELDSRGIASLAVDLPGHGASTAPFTDLHGDAASVTELLHRLDRSVVLVGHSYGGAVITQAAAGIDHVRHLVYLTAYVPDVGQAVSAMAVEMPPAESALSGAIVIAPDHTSTINPDLANDAFYGHCDPMASSANIARLCPQPFATFTQPVSIAAWHTIPSTYVRCTDDRAIHISHQDLMAARCSSIESLATDHSPFASMPVETAELIARIVRDRSASDNPT